MRLREFTPGTLRRSIPSLVTNLGPLQRAIHEVVVEPEQACACSGQWTFEAYQCVVALGLDRRPTRVVVPPRPP